MQVVRAFRGGERGLGSPGVVDLPLDLLRSDMFMTMRPVPDERIVVIAGTVWPPLPRR